MAYMHSNLKVVRESTMSLLLLCPPSQHYAIHNASMEFVQVTTPAYVSRSGQALLVMKVLLL